MIGISSLLQEDLSEDPLDFNDCPAPASPSTYYPPWLALGLAERVNHVDEPGRLGFHWIETWRWEYDDGTFGPWHTEVVFDDA